MADSSKEYVQQRGCGRRGRVDAAEHYESSKSWDRRRRGR